MNRQEAVKVLNDTIFDIKGWARQIDMTRLEMAEKDRLEAIEMAIQALEQMDKIRHFEVNREVMK